MGIIKESHSLFYGFVRVILFYLQFVVYQILSMELLRVQVLVRKVYFHSQMRKFTLIF